MGKKIIEWGNEVTNTGFCLFTMYHKQFEIGAILIWLYHSATKLLVLSSEDGKVILWNIEGI